MPCLFPHVLDGILAVIEMQTDKETDKPAADNKEGMPKAKTQHRRAKEQAYEQPASLAAVILPKRSYYFSAFFLHYAVTALDHTMFLFRLDVRNLRHHHIHRHILQCHCATKMFLHPVRQRLSHYGNIRFPAYG